MLKLFIATCALYMCPTVADAEPTLATQWSRHASDLSEEIQTALAGEAIALSTEDEIARFAVNASRLANAMAQFESAQGLACIFQGISEDADLQLRLLHMPGERQNALRRLATLFHDAERIGLAAAHIRGGQPGGQTAESLSCEADPEAAYQYLTEQP